MQMDPTTLKKYKNKSKKYKIGQDTVLAAGLLELDAGLEVDVP